MQVNLYQNKLNIKYFLYEIVHHCNLNCKGCDHCAPIAEPEFVDLERYKKDLEKIKKTFHIIDSIGVMGGEPLLHPDFLEIVKITRKVLKYTGIFIFTNGICLKDKDDKFWKALGKEKANFIITRYNLDLNYRNIEATARQHGVYISYENGNKLKNEFNKIRLDLNASMDAEYSHTHCFQAQFCPTLENGILYRCPIVPAARHFNKYFNKNLIVSKGDGIDLYKRPKKEEILSYFNNPIPFCRYCDIKERDKMIKWEISKKDIQEWT